MKARRWLGLLVLCAAACASPKERLGKAVKDGLPREAEAAIGDGASPQGDRLHWAIIWGHIEVVRVLLAYGADPNHAPKSGFATAVEGKTPLMLAMQEASLKKGLAIAAMLLDAGADPTVGDPDWPPLFDAMRWFVGEDLGEDMALLFVAKVRNPDFRTPVGNALELSLSDGRRSYPQVTEALLKKGAKLSASAVLAIALARGDRSLLEQLLGQGAGLDVPCAERSPAPCAGLTALGVAASRGDLSTMELLLRHEAKIEAPVGGTSALHAAARAGKADAVKLLLARGAELATRDGSGATALHGAGSVEVIRLLIAAGLPVDVADNDGDTPLSWAIALRQREAVVPPAEQPATAEIGEAGTVRQDQGAPLALTFLASGAAPDRPDSTGVRPLFAALRNRDHLTAQRLLELEVDPRPKSPSEVEPVALLVEVRLWGLPEEDAGFYETLESLLRHGASANVRTAAGQPVLALAVDKGDAALARLLLDHGADPAVAQALVETTTQKVVVEGVGNPMSLNMGREEREIPHPDVAAASTPRDKVIAAASARRQRAREDEAEGSRRFQARAAMAAEEEVAREKADQERAAADKERDAWREKYDRCLRDGILDEDDCRRRSR